MKYAITFLMCAVILNLPDAFAQTSPLDPVCTFNYQAVVRDANDNVLTNRAIKVQLTILDGPGGNALHIEQHDATTTTLGLVNLEVGAGMRVGGSLVFEAIPWAIRKHYLRVEVDPDGGANFVDLGESPILAVPIAVQAKVAAFAIQTLDTIKLFDTIRVRTIRTDTIKAKVACMDTIKADVVCVDTLKADYGEIGVMLNDKMYTSGICAIDATGMIHEFLYDDPQVGLTAQVSKLNAIDVCTDLISIVDAFGGPPKSVIGQNIIGEILGDFDYLPGCVRADTLKPSKLLLNGPNACIGIFDDVTGLTFDFIGTNPEDGLFVDVAKVKSTNICVTGFIDLVDPDNPDAGPVGFIGVNSSGVSGVDADIVQATCVNADSVKTDDICVTGNFAIKNADGETVFEIEPNAGLDYFCNIVGNVMIQGGLAAEFKQFLIDHPLDPENKRLRHFSIESDRLTNIYNGTAELDKNGRATIELPYWFEALNTDFSYQLTCIGRFANVYVAQEINENQFQIAGGEAGMKVSWQVSGVRHDKQALEQSLPIEEWK